MIYKLYTDGAASNNGYDEAYGGFAWAIVANDKIMQYDSQFIKPATNNICELKALIEGCKILKEILEPLDVVLVFSDSAYCINCYKQNWYKNWRKNGWLNSKKQPVANKELWEELIPFFENAQFKFDKVKGHANDEFNNFVDRLAVEAKFKKRENS